MRRTSTLGLFCGLAIGAAALTTSDAQAHFRLQAPASMTEQNDLGNPQKAYPCGDDSMTLTGESTAFNAGDSVSITINETIYHPGHYRVALALNDMSELPPDPPVTPIPNVDECAMTEIMNPPVFPVIADGMLPHNSSFDGEQTFEVTLPDDVECENCILQVVQYMSSHAAPCFYYHCAEISIAPSAGSGDSTGEDPGTTTDDPTGEPGTTTGDPDPTGTPGETSDGNSDSDDTADPSGPGGETTADATATAGGTGTDGMGQDSSGSSGGCSVAGGTGSAMLALFPLLFALRRRD